MIWKISKSKLIYILLFIAFLYFRIIEINRPLWADELITVRTTFINPIANPLYNTVSTNLPLFYYSVKLFEILTFGLINLRYLNIILSAFTIIFIFKKYENLSKLVKILLIVFLIISPLQIYYSIELRAYTLAQLLLIINFYYFQKKDFNKWFWISSYLLCLTHYACYVYLLSVAIFYFLQNKGNWNQVYKFITLGVFGSLITYLVSRNVGFSDSTGLSIINNNFSRFNFSNILENVLKIRETVAVYYNFGLHYYRVENDFLSIIKKLTQILIGIYVIITIINYKKHKQELQNMLFLGSLFFFSIILDLAGIMTFGGRYVFPFHFLYLLILAYFLEIVYKTNKYLCYGLAVIFITAFLTYNYCLSINLDIFRGSNDPQGSLYQKCVEKISKNK